MKTVILFTFLIQLFTINAQPTQFKTVFTPHSVTYNGSKNPSQCWEAVDQGVLIEFENHSYFFLLPAREFELLRKQLIDQEVLIEVVYFEEATQGSGAAGRVVRVSSSESEIFFPIDAK